MSFTLSIAEWHTRSSVALKLKNGLGRRWQEAENMHGKLLCRASVKDVLGGMVCEVGLMRGRSTGFIEARIAYTGVITQ